MTDVDQRRINWQARARPKLRPETPRQSPESERDDIVIARIVKSMGWIALGGVALVAALVAWVIIFITLNLGTPASGAAGLILGH